MSKVRVAVVIASLGRPDAVSDWVEMIEHQTCPPDLLVFSVTSEKDLPPENQRGNARILIGPKGLPAQRNTALDAIQTEADIIIFFDDDYIPSKFALERIVTVFGDNPDVAGITGHLLADGIKGPGISSQDAKDMVRAYDLQSPSHYRILGEQQGLYGCNMAYRASEIQTVRFDTRLPLYGWQEDVDFAVALQQFSGKRLIKTDAFAGVHRGAKGGRTSGVKLGYSQIANPMYLVQKGTMRKRSGFSLMLRNILANHARTFWPEPWVDRFGRVKGNWIAIRDFVIGNMKPERILELD